MSMSEPTTYEPWPPARITLIDVFAAGLSVTDP
jgi:hypothetical protein